MTEFPFLPHPHRDETVAAADAGPGAPEPAPGFGIDENDPSTARPTVDEGGSPADAGDVPFRTPDPDDVGPR